VLSEKWSYSPNKEKIKLGTFYDAKLDDEEGIFLLLQQTIPLSAVLIQVNKDGKELFRQDIDFGANSIDINQDGIYVVGFHYRNIPNKTGVVYTPDVALLDKSGKTIWHVIPPPPFEIKDIGDKESIWDLSAVGDIELWKVYALSNGGCVAMGRMQSEKGNFLYHLRLNKHGKVLWHNPIPAELNWMYFYPNKVEPHLEEREDCIFSIGAAVLKTIKSNTELSVVKFRLSDGKVLQQFSHNSPYSYSCSAINHITGDIAIGYCTKDDKGGILILDDDARFITNLDTPITPWVGIGWIDKNKIWIGGTEQDERSYLDYPGCALIEYNTSGITNIKFNKTFFADKVFDKVKISPIQNGCFMAYAANKSETEDIINRTEVVVRKITMDESLEHRFSHEDAIHSKVRLVPIQDGHFVICDWNDYYPVLYKY